MRAYFIVAFLITAVQVGETEEGPVLKEKWKTDYTEKTWGLKIKTVKYTTGQDPAQVNVVLEFSKDLKAEELKALKDAFSKKESTLEFCFFDHDGVIFAKVSYGQYSVQGDISGIKGDAIRLGIGRQLNGPLHFMNFPESAKKVAKVELRPPPPN